jgi:tetratricopeptide (TPR) repeat protein
MRRRAGWRRGRLAPRRRDDEARTRAKALLRAAGEALETGDRTRGLELLERAVAADPTFVEPPLALAAQRARDGDEEGAGAMVELAVQRGREQVERIPPKKGGPAWWHDPATRPYLKALVAHGVRRFARGDARGAAEQFLAVFEREPSDPLEAGLYAAEALLAAGDPMGALGVYARLEEGPAVCYGRALALLATDQRREAVLSLWLGLLLNARVAEGLLGPLPFAGIERAELVGDAREAEEIVARTAGLWTPQAREWLTALASHEPLRADLRRWAELVRVLEGEEEGGGRALGAIEAFLDPERLAREADVFLAGRRAPPRRLPQA